MNKSQVLSKDGVILHIFFNKCHEKKVLDHFSILSSLSTPSDCCCVLMKATFKNKYTVPPSSIFKKSYFIEQLSTVLFSKSKSNKSK